MIQKTYNIKVHRKIASTELIKTNPVDSHFNLNCLSDRRKSEIENNLETIIYSIEKKKNTIILYSNTTNIKITNKFYKDIPLYNYILTSKEDLEGILLKIDTAEFVTENKDTSVIVYFNYNYNNYLPDVNRLNHIGNPLTRSDNIKVRKLKDRLKITISGVEENNVDIRLGSRYVFEPKFYRNYIEFFESLVKIGSKIYYLYNNSFNHLDKKEMYLDRESKVKDPIINFNSIEENGKYFLYTYSSWRSNLLYDQKINSDFYYYLNTDSANATDLLVQSYQKIFDEKLLLIYSNEKQKQDYEVTTNPYLATDITTPLGENYSLLFQEAKDNKYSIQNNIKLGTERLVLDFNKIITQKTKYLVKEDGTVIYQTIPIKDIPNNNVKTLEDLPLHFKNNLDELNTKLNNISNGQTTTFDNKIYT